MHNTLFVVGLLAIVGQALAIANGHFKTPRMRHHARPDALTQPPFNTSTFLELHDAAFIERRVAVGAREDGAEDGSAPPSVSGDDCDVCTYVLENKEVMQPYLCRGLQQPSQQMACVNTLLSLLWWMPNEVYWINYGCQRAAGDAWSWVRPCPPHVICSWIKTVTSGNEKAYCPESTSYRKPQ